MSNDLEHRPSPPDFDAEDEENKDDDQMFKSARLPITDDVRLSDDEDEDNPFGELSEKPKTSLTIQSVTPVAVPEASSPVKQESQLFPVDSGVHSTEKISLTTQLENSSLTNEITHPTIAATTDLKATKKRSNEHNIEITVSDPTKVGEVC